MSLPRKQLESWLSTIDVKTDSVLDVGGATLPIKERIRSWQVKHYKILDILEQGRKAKADYIKNLNYEIKDIGQFDIIFCTEVMQFIFNPVIALDNLWRMLKEGGELYINFHFSHAPMKGTDYLRYTKLGATHLLEISGFKIIDIQESSTGYFIKAICRKR